MIFRYIRNKNDGRMLGGLILCGIVSILIGLFTAFISIPNTILPGLVTNIIVTFILASLVSTDAKSREYIILIIYSLMVALITFTMVYNFSEILQYPLWFSVIIIIVITEVLFFLDKTTPGTIETDNIVWFTTKRKIEAIIESTLIYIGIKSIYDVLSSIKYAEYYPYLIEYAKDIILVIIAVGLLYGYMWLNSLRYKKK